MKIIEPCVAVYKEMWVGECNYIEIEGIEMKLFVVLLSLCCVDVMSSRNRSWHHGQGRYDYIIVGGGTAGCVLASRLSEDPDVNVLLLESGPSDLTNPYISVPLMFAALQREVIRPSVDWQFKTEPQMYAGKELINKTSLWPQGRVLGGSSSINAMKLSRGSRHDYDLWRDLGNEGWGYEDVLPYFKKLEDVQEKSLMNEYYRGVGGPIPVIQSNVSKLAEIFVEGGKELGYMDTDQNAAQQKGFGYIQHNSRHGRRVNTAEAYIRPVQHRSNLEVRTATTVHKIKTRHGRAVGVYFKHEDGSERHLRAIREVVLCAGAIMSPVVLMHSGIGPKQHLHDIGIKKVVADLPVGQGLEDHVFTHLNFVINESLSSCPVNSDSFQSMFQYILSGKGHWSTTGTQGSAYMKSDKQPLTEQFPNLELFMTSCLIGHSNRTADIWKYITGSSNQYYDSFHSVERDHEGLMMFPVLLHPRTTGRVELSTNNIDSKPRIVYNYLEHPDDVADLIQGIRIVQDLVKTPAFQAVGTRLASGSMKYPGCVVHELNSDDYWECYIRHKTFTDYHYSSTCHMGVSGVVDSRLRVHGVRGLRVVDASVLPRGVSGNTMLPVIMIAEKAADMIKQDNTPPVSPGGATNVTMGL